MTTTVNIVHGENGQSWSHQTVISDEAHKRARTNFNPSGLDRVKTIKALTAALYTELKAIDGDDTAKHEAATAMTQLQGAAMFGVSAATAHLS